MLGKKQDKNFNPTWSSEFKFNQPVQILVVSNSSHHGNSLKENILLLLCKAAFFFFYPSGH